MEIQRCPECGKRLDSNYCDICMKRVPFRGMPQGKTTRPRDASSAHRSEAGHRCVQFSMAEEDVRPSKSHPAPQKTKTGGNKWLALLPIGIILVSFLVNILGIIISSIQEAVQNLSAPETEIVDYDESAREIPYLEQQLLYESPGLLITSGNLDVVDEVLVLPLTVENLGDMTITVALGDLSVNGYMFPSSLAEDVESESIETYYLPLYSDKLKEFQIQQVEELGFFLNIWDADTYRMLATTDLFSLKTDAYGQSDQMAEPDGIPLYADEQMEVFLRRVEFSPYGSGTVELFVENHTDESIFLHLEGAALDGTSVSGQYWGAVNPRCRRIDDYNIYDLENIQNPEETQTLSFQLELETEDGETQWSTTITTAIQDVLVK